MLKNKRGNSSLYIIILVFFLLTVVVFTFEITNNNFINSIEREKNIEYELELQNAINDIEIRATEFIRKNCESSKTYIDKIILENKITDINIINELYYQDLKNRVEKSDKNTNFKRSDVYNIERRVTTLNKRGFQNEVLFTEFKEDRINEKTYKLTVIVKKENKEKGLNYRELFLKTYYPSYSELSGNKTREIVEIYYGY